MSHAITVDDLPPSTAEFVRGQGRARGLADPLPAVTHGLRTDEETMNRESRGGPTSDRYVVEMLLTPDLLVISYRDGAVEDDPAAQVSFHRLYQVEFSPLPAELLELAPILRRAGLMP